MRAYHKSISIFLTLCFIPSFVHGSVVVTEIMYNPEGNDEGREWVEILNTGSESINLSSGWKFYENGKNHLLSITQGDGSVLAGAYAIIADKPEIFLSEWPSFSGILFDSSFSLVNSESSVGLLLDGALVGEVSYSSESGGAGDGASLQLVSGVLIAASPTPGVAYEAGGATATYTDDTETDSASYENNAPSSDAGWVPDTNDISVSSGLDRRAIVGADIAFRASARGTAGVPLSRADYIWNFGDGTIAKGEHVLHAYRYPGVYAVFVSVQSGKYSATDRITVTAEPADIVISRVETGADSLIELENRSSRELDISFWQLSDGRSLFPLPEHTVLFSGKKIIFPYSVTGLFFINPSDAALMYPNGSLAVSYALPAPPPAPYVPREPYAVDAVHADTAPITGAAVFRHPEISEDEGYDTEAPAFAGDALTGAAVTAVEAGSVGGGALFLFGMLAVALAGAFGAVLSRKHGENEGDRYTIIDETTDHGGPSV
ncbi:MAG: hypothetical protein COW88_03565 [Candidatus Lloydbacteria bacterium CG22_combo_CG10-13_8_21_14_all_47_15]|uniref:PKD domain-containing protein n=1 Tax=Candidatus Lloydbacteria bacterium CG22_combo_CG10-13_8_21_14_all_47_15 TaxID=1974635 RepID=A0A2H0CSS3_9BACT|nr:MAG: hypothetical protein COW88_03565 [Candidatus Lloydbacteria bacterium CG22_combo_CG10-13_8_21_14_all_47_15]